MHRNRTLPLLMISYGNRCFEFKETFLGLRAPKDESSGDTRPIWHDRSPIAPDWPDFNPCLIRRRRRGLRYCKPASPAQSLRHKPLRTRYMYHVFSSAIQHNAQRDFFSPCNNHGTPKTPPRLMRHRAASAYRLPDPLQPLTLLVTKQKEPRTEMRGSLFTLETAKCPLLVSDVLLSHGLTPQYHRRSGA